MANFTPEDVVAAYKTKGLRARRYALNLTVESDGTCNNTSGRCCALGALGSGLRLSPHEVARIGQGGALCETLGVDWEAFTNGFDGRSHWHGQHPDYLLGVACREAVAAAGLFDPDSE